MKKIIPFLVSGILMVGAVACQQDASKTSDAGTTNEAPANTAKEATSKTADNAKTAITDTATKATDAAKTTTGGAKTALTNATGGVKTIVKNRLEEKFPGSKLSVEEKEGVLTVKGTVPDQATLKKIEPAVKEYKFQGVKTVKVEATVAGNKAQ
jgi:hyperosmotically inducible periplasmic protein